MRLAALAALPILLSAQTPAAKPAAPGQAAVKRPKLLLAITVDQFRYDYLIRFRDQYNSGLAKLLTSGAVFTNAYYDHFPTVTAIGHSTLLSGAMPSVSGIIGNEWYDRKAGKQVTSVSDDDYEMLGGVARGTQGRSASPRRMLVSTIGDELKMAGRQSKVVGISVKDRSAILPAGHMADGAYWFDPNSGNFVSSTFYFKDLPSWVKDFNSTRYADKFAGQAWTPVGGGKPFDTLPGQPGKPLYDALERNPAGNELVMRFALAAMAGEQLGKHEGTDVLAVSFSANDYVGHRKGPDAPEVRDISIRTDRTLGELFKAIDAQIGMRNVVVVLTADHGVSPVPEVNQARKMPGGRILDPGATVQAKLAEKYGEGKWIEGRTGESLYLNRALISQKKLPFDEVLNYAAEAARSIPHMFRVYTRTQLAAAAVRGDAIDRRVLNGFNDVRACDITVVSEPFYIYEKGTGTSHGMPFQYDAHVPVILMGPGIKPGKYHRKAAPNDIAPTLATLLEIETPSGALGRVLDEALN